MTTFIDPQRLVARGKSSVAVMNALFLLSAGQFPNQMATQAEAVRLSTLANIDKRSMRRLIFWAIATGLGLALWIHLVTYHEFGCNVLEGAAAAGGAYRTMATRREFDETVALVLGNVARDVRGERNTVLGGAGFVLLLHGVKLFWIKSPFNPLGYALAMYRGYFCWGPFSCHVAFAQHYRAPRGKARLSPPFPRVCRPCPGALSRQRGVYRQRGNFLRPTNGRRR